MYSQADEPNERQKRMLALAWATEPELTDETLAYALSGAVRAQDSAALIQAVANRGGQSLQAAWAFLKE